MLRPNSAALKCECLEARDVPAVVLEAQLSGNTPSTRDIAPVGGTVNITEISFDTTQPLLRRNATNAPRQSKAANANDSLQFSLSGTTLTITSSDGIFGRVSNFNNAIVAYGNTLTVNNVTGLQIGLQLGGDDIVTDNTPLNTFIDGGDGSDTITATGGASNPLLFQLLRQRGALNPLVFSQVVGSLPAKTLLGSGGNDTLSISGAASLSLLDGGDGFDTINGPASGALNILRGGLGDDTINGVQFGFFDLLDGGPGRDTVTGGFGAELLIGGTGGDLLFGLGGGDFYLAQDVDQDVIGNQVGDLVFADPFDILTTP